MKYKKVLWHLIWELPYSKKATKLHLSILDWGGMGGSVLSSTYTRRYELFAITVPGE